MAVDAISRKLCEPAVDFRSHPWLGRGFLLGIVGFIFCTVELFFGLLRLLRLSGCPIVVPLQQFGDAISFGGRIERPMRERFDIYGVLIQSVLKRTDVPF